MAGSTSKSSRDLASLRSAVSSISSLLTQLQSSSAPTDSSTIPPPSSSPPSSTDSRNKIDALSLAHDSVSLIKAQTTKLSLLVISAPFTPSAVTSILRALSSGAVPTLASSLALCTPAAHTRLLSGELHFRVTRVFARLNALVAAIPLDGSVLEKESRDGGRGSLAGTGAVWDACDEVVKMKGLGISGVCAEKVEGWRELVKDALEELREWGEEEGSDDEVEDKDEADDEDEDKERDPQDIADSLFDSPPSIPKSDPDHIRPRLETTLRRLRLLVLLYTALIKRRFKTIPSPATNPHHNSSITPSSIITSIDVLLDRLKHIPDAVDELASAFYDLDAEAIDTRMRECFGAARDAAEMAERGWSGAEDEFTTWVAKFKSSMDESS